MRIIIDESNYVFDPGPVLDNEDNVERDGYRSTEEIVMEMICAGQRLQEFRREEFDTIDDDIKDEDFINPTVMRDYDSIDAMSDMSKLEAKYKAAIKSAEEKKKKDQVKEPVDQVKEPVDEPVK